MVCSQWSVVSKQWSVFLITDHRPLITDEDCLIRPRVSGNTLLRTTVAEFPPWRSLCFTVVPRRDLIKQSSMFYSTISNNLWRRGRDSNPRYGFPYARLPSVWFQPLTHLSDFITDGWEDEVR